MMARTGRDWLFAMIALTPDDYEVYFDDSGTHEESPVAVAACYIATKQQWDEFCRNWKELTEEEGFDYFHMTDFMLNPEKKRKPYCDWDDSKKWRVYWWATALIRIRAQHGFALTITKKDYDECVPDDMRKFYGKDHYVWAIKAVTGQIAEWRKKWGVKRPMQYVFSQVQKGKGTKGEILAIESSLPYQKDSEEKYGLIKDGIGFQDMRAFPPLQAADILAWNMLDHHNNVIARGRDDVHDVSKWFYRLRAGRPMDIGFLTRAQMEDFSRKIGEYRETQGRLPSRYLETLFQKEQRRIANAKEKQRGTETRHADGRTAENSPQRDRERT
jgi:hypothetical protein